MWYFNKFVTGSVEILFHSEKEWATHRGCAVDKPLYQEKPDKATQAVWLPCNCISHSPFTGTRCPTPTHYSREVSFWIMVSWDSLDGSFALRQKITVQWNGKGKVFISWRPEEWSKRRDAVPKIQPCRALGAHLVQPDLAPKDTSTTNSSVVPFSSECRARPPITFQRLQLWTHETLGVHCRPQP